jgi:hypothetical protein
MGALTIMCILAPMVWAGAEPTNLIPNSGFEQPLDYWAPLWTRTSGGTASLDRQLYRSGRQSLRIEHTGQEDWSFHPKVQIPAKPGEIYELSGWVQLKGQGRAELSVVLRDPRGKVLDWSHGKAETAACPQWRQLRSRFIVPANTASIQPRLIGYGPATVWLDDVQLVLLGSIDQRRSKSLPEQISLSNKHLELTLNTSDESFAVRDLRCGRVWRQSSSQAVVLEAAAQQHTLQMRLLEPASMSELTATVQLDPDRPEAVVEISAGDGKPPWPDMTRPLEFPAAFVTEKGQLLIMPVNEGICYPVDDQSLPSMHYILYGGHGLCMAWYGQVQGEEGLMTLVETPDDASVRVPRVDGLLRLVPIWEPQMGKFGPPRRLRWVLFDRGGYVAMCKRYRQYAQQIGLLKTLAEKRKENPNVDLLVGAVNVWCWEKDPVAICRQLQAAGIQRILWSRGGSPDELTQLNQLPGVLTSRYDIYQDVMDPANFPKLRGVHRDWTTPAWPKDLMLDRNGDWVRGWRVRGKDGQWYPCGVLCDRQAIPYAQQRIPEELKTHPYRCRFIDTTTATPWRECYHPDHPMTRSESRQWKMRLLEYVSKDCKLVTGSETGHDAAVPYVHYFEGMLSLGPYRVPDAGRDMQRIWDEVPEPVAKFQTGHYYRLPLWELVYHDCVVAQWYWGDYNNKLPKVWDRRDLLNALYGTPPMFMFNLKFWRENRKRFVESYRATSPIARATGYSEMLSHKWLTEDRTVQQTQFANGVVVTVNFGDRPYKMADGTVVAPLGQHVRGLPEE